MIHEIVVVGLGHAFEKFYASVLASREDVKVIGLVDEDESRNRYKDVFPDAWFKSSIDQVSNNITPERIALVLTPDHYETIRVLSGKHFKRFIVEKPLVSRDTEIAKLVALIKEFELKVYAIDFYIPKLFPFQVATGRITDDDPRFGWVRQTPFGDTPVAFPSAVDGIAVQVLESGSFCLPDLAKRPWLEQDHEIGGMLRDLGTHALAPLITAGLLTDAAQVEHVALGRINDTRDGICVAPAGGVELYASFLLSDCGVPVSVTLGKVPFERSGVWSLTVRGENHEMFFAGLRTGQPSILITREGQVRYDVVKPTYELVIQEALLYFEGKLPAFDGNLGALLGSLQLLESVRAAYRPF